MRAWSIGLLLWALGGCVVTEQTGPRQEPATDDARIQAHLSVARAYLQGGDTQRARVALERAAAVDPNDLNVLLLYAALYELEGEFGLAEDWYRRALRRSRRDARVNNNYGAFLYARGRYSDAAKALAIASEDPDYPNRPQALMNLGQAALQVPDHAQALAAFQRAVSLNPELGRGHLEVAALLSEQGDFEVARIHYEQFRRRVRQNARSLFVGIRIARGLSDTNGEASFAMQLRNMFPDSREHSEYQRMRR